MVHRPSSRQLTPLFVLLAFGVAVTGCSAVPDYDPEPPKPSVTAVVPPDGVSLRQIGVENGPIDAVTVPRDHSLTLLTSQDNVVTLVFSSPDAEALAEWFRTTLPEAGWEITADGGDALVFHGHGWDGAFTPLGNGDPGGSFSLRLQGH